MFEPLKQTIELLKTYDQEMPESTHKQLEVMWRLQCWVTRYCFESTFPTLPVSSRKNLATSLFELFLSNFQSCFIISKGIIWKIAFWRLFLFLATRVC